MKEKLAKVNWVKVSKAFALGCQVLGAGGSIVMATFDLAEGIQKINKIKENQTKEITDSVASTIEEAAEA